MSHKPTVIHLLRSCYTNTIIALILFPFVYVQVFTTTIIAYRTGVAVYIATDSRARDGNGRILPPICKIHIIGNAAIAHTGFHSGGSYNADSIVCQSHRTSRTLKEFYGIYSQKMSDALTARIIEVQAAGDTTYHPREGPIRLVQAAIADMPNGVPHLVVLDFYAIVRDSADVTVYYLRGDCPGDCPRDTFMFVGGISSAIERILPGEKPVRLLDSLGVVAGIDSLITLQSHATPDSVSPPIDIVRVNHLGAEWIQQKENCYGYSHKEPRLK